MLLQLEKALSIQLIETLKQIGQYADKLNIKINVVGGFVRDLLLNKQNNDIDIAVEGDAIPFTQSLSEYFNLTCKTFDRFHTAKILINEFAIDFASSRKEIYEYPGALPTVTLSSNIYDDLFRRDFTINAMAMSLNDNNLFHLVDFFNGYKDLQNGIIRVLHEKSFQDDPTRLYRAIRFAHRFNFRLENNTWQLFKQASKNKYASNISIKRISAELSRIFREANPAKILKTLKHFKLLSQFPYTKDIHNLKLAKMKLESNPDITTLYWIYLLSLIGFELRKNIIKNMGLPHNMRLLIENGLDALRVVPKQIKELSINDHIRLFELLENFSPEALAALTSIALDKNDIEKVVFYVNHLRGTSPQITGKDLLQIDIPPGPHIKNILDYITELKLEGRCLTIQEELEIGKQLYSNIRH